MWRGCRLTATHGGDGVVVGEGEGGVGGQQAGGVDALHDQLLDVGRDVVAQVAGPKPVQRHHHHRPVPATWPTTPSLPAGTCNMANDTITTGQYLQHGQRHHHHRPVPATWPTTPSPPAGTCNMANDTITTGRYLQHGQRHHHHRPVPATRSTPSLPAGTCNMVTLQLAR